MKEVPLTRGYVALVDDEDHDRLMQVKWFAKIAYHSDRLVYAYRQTRIRKGLQRPEIMHRFLMDAQPGQEVDHIDGNGLNNQRSNLRLVTRRQNMLNRVLPQTNKSGYRGVCFRRGRWVAQITSQNKVYHLGQFGTPEEAALAYDKAALIHNGPFAQLNFPERNHR